MLNYHISFGSPWYLAVIPVLLPLLWWFSLRSLAPLGRVRSLIAIALRSIILVLILVALADVQMVRTTDKLTVIYLLDQSASIPEEQAKAMVDYVNAAVERHRQNEDRVGVIAFGREAAIEVPPFDDDIIIQAIESPLDPEYTNLADAIKLAKASFPEDAARRIVIVSDGNQNLGDVSEQAQGAAGAGIGIDVLPIHHQARSEVIVERLAIPSNIRQGAPFDLKVVVTNTAQPTAEDSGEVRGRLKLSQIVGGEPQLLSDDPKVLKPGKNVFTVTQQIDSANFYRYEARFEPEDSADDAMRQNNRATAFTHVRGTGQVLLIENYEEPTEFNQLAERLRGQKLEVTIRPSDQLFTAPDDLLPFDTVLLANVPREHFTDEQIRILVRNTQQMGAGLVMLGGPHSFGAGGWTGSELEKAMPVEFQIKSAKVVPRGALVMLMHACEIPKGNHWQKVIAHEAIKALGVQDYCGLLFWGAGGDQWMWGKGLMPVGGNRGRMMARVDRMTPGDMPQFEPAMRMALKGFRAKPVGDEAAIKHMIIISDGDPSPPSRGVIAALKNEGVTISTVAVGAHGPAESRVLANIAQACGGKYYAVKNARALPRIFQREARRVARPLIFDKYPVQPYVKFPNEMVGGLKSPLPPIKGFVLTSKKDNPLVEVSLVSPRPAGERNSTILASWTYGLGRAVAFTSDSGTRWTDEWLPLAMYDRLFGQIVRWSMRPSGDATKNFTVATEVEDEQVRMVITALDKDDEFLNFLNMSGNAMGPGLKPIPVKIEQTAPGRYVGTFPATEAGSYFMVVSPGAPDTAPILTGINVPYSDEYRQRETNAALLGELARMVPEGGKAGQVIEEKDSKLPEPLLAVNTFRHGELPKATSSQDVWFYVMLACSCLFFFDVFFRRVQISFAWVAPLLGAVRDTILGRQPQLAEVATMERLRSRKAEVTGRIEQLRADARFEPSSEAATQLEDVEEMRSPKPAKPGTPSLDTAAETEEESYTERLLRAKKKLWDDRPKKE